MSGEDDESFYRNRRGRNAKHPSVAELKREMSGHSVEESGGAPNEDGPQQPVRSSNSPRHLGNNDPTPLSDNNKTTQEPNRREQLRRHTLFDSIFRPHKNDGSKGVLHVMQGTPIELPPSGDTVGHASPEEGLVSWRRTTFHDLQPQGVLGSELCPVIEDGKEDVEPHRHMTKGHDESVIDFQPRTDSIKGDLHVIHHSQTAPHLVRPKPINVDTKTQPSKSSLLENAKFYTIGRSTDTSVAIKHFLSQRKGHRKMFDSYDYQLVDSKVWHDRERKETSCWTCFGLKSVNIPEIMVRKNFGRDARLAVISLGIAVALGGIALSECTDHLLSWKLSYTIGMAEQYEGSRIWGFDRAFLIYVGISCAFGFVAYLFVVWSPASLGSGLAEVKTILNGVHLEKITSLWTALAKCVGVVFAVSSGLPVGIEGPVIHLGLVLGEQFSQIKNVLHNDRHRRDFAACGTAAGVAAAFHTPIGGVLFALEEGASFWSTLLTWRAFSCSIVTMITVYFVYGVKHPQIPIDVFNVLGDFDYENIPQFSVWQLIIFALIGCVGGIVGAGWIILNTKLNSMRRKLKVKARFVEIMAIVISMSSLTWWLSYVKGTCLNIPSSTSSRFFRNTVQYNFNDGQYNDMASLFMNNQEITIQALFHEPLGTFTWQSAAIVGCIYYVMSIITFGAWTSCGIFVPAILMGAGFGRAIGEYSKVSAGAYAIVGCGATLGGITRVLISITIMTTDPLRLPLVVRVGALRNLLEEVSYNGFPIIDPQTKPIPDLTWNELEEFYPYPPPTEIVDPDRRKDESGMLLDLSPYIQIAPHTFEHEGSAERAYELFRSLGIRHLPIVDKLGRCVGMVTRADLTEENLHRAYLGSTDSYLADVDRVGFRRAAPEPICLKKL